MNNFTYYNPVKLVFGKNTIEKLSKHCPQNAKILLTYGGGSIKRNGIYDQVLQALKGWQICEFGGIEPNPKHETLLKAAEFGVKEKVDFILAVGGGSVIDGTKFIAMAMSYLTNNPWKMWKEYTPIKHAYPFGAVLTLAATGSEMNTYAVISDSQSGHKYANGATCLYPTFAILDPSTTFTLDERQIKNGIIDPFVHVTEQYLTYPVNSPLQDRQAESILQTLIEEGPKVFKSPHDYDVRSNLMWCATQALNSLISCGVPQDWSTHGIGHELTSFYGLDHAQTLAIVLPGVLRHQINEKSAKLAQCGQRVFGIKEKNQEQAAQLTITEIENFFISLGVKTKLSAYGLSKEKFKNIAEGATASGQKLGEHQNLGPKEVLEILELIY